MLSVTARRAGFGRVVKLVVQFCGSVEAGLVGACGLASEDAAVGRGFHDRRRHWLDQSGRDACTNVAVLRTDLVAAL